LLINDVDVVGLGFGKQICCGDFDIWLQISWQSPPAYRWHHICAARSTPIPVAVNVHEEDRVMA
jgi:hypothetical protein